MPIVKQFQENQTRTRPFAQRSWIDDLSDWLGITSPMKDRPQWGLQRFINEPRDPTYGRADLIRRLSERFAERESKRRLRGESFRETSPAFRGPGSPEVAPEYPSVSGRSMRLRGRDREPTF